METIYVALLNEGTQVWRPVDAKLNSDGTFTIPLSALVPEGEEWEFVPGETVRCKQQSISAGEYCLAAFEQVSINK